ncbi:MAG TPA: hypothetical protein DIW47_04815 [Bacteroidetes bacterium]|nr:hypothetical protein [Bacteroidota bacterium]
MRIVFSIITLFIIVYTHGQYDESDFIPAKKKGKWGYVHIISKKPLIAYEYQEVRSFKGELGAVKKGGKWGFIDYYGRVVIEIKYDDVKEFDYEYCAVKQGKKWGVIDRRGEIKVPFKYKDCEYWSYDQKVVATLNGKKGLITISDSILLPFQYDEILKPYHDDYITVHQNGKAAFLNEDVKFISEFEFETFFDPTFIGMLVKQNGKFGIMNYKGELPIAAEYDSIFTFGMDGVEGRYFFCCKDGGQSLWTITGKELVSPDYDWIYPIFDITDYVTDTMMNAYALLSTIVEVDGKYSILKAYSEDTLLHWYDSILHYCTDDYELSYSCRKIEMKWVKDDYTSSFYLQNNMDNYGYYSLFWRRENHPFLIYALNNNFGIIHCDGRVLTEANYSLKYLTDNAPVFDQVKRLWLFENELLKEMEIH